MTLKYALFGLCFGWLLMPRWRGRKLKMPTAVTAYTTAVITALLITYYLDYEKQAWLFTMGMAIQLMVFAAAKWIRYCVANFGRNIRR